MPSWTHTIHSSAAPEQIWPWYADPAIWPAWDTGLERVTLDGPFAVGSSGTLVVTGQPPLTYELTEVTAGRSFSDVTEIPGVVTLTFHHRLQSDGSGGTVLTSTIEAVGPAADEMLPMVTSDTPEAMAALVRLAETEAPLPARQSQ